MTSEAARFDTRYEPMQMTLTPPVNDAADCTVTLVVDTTGTLIFPDVLGETLDDAVQVGAAAKTFPNENEPVVVAENEIRARSMCSEADVLPCVTYGTYPAALPLIAARIPALLEATFKIKPGFASPSDHIPGKFAVPGKLPLNESAPVRNNKPFVAEKIVVHALFGHT